MAPLPSRSPADVDALVIGAGIVGCSVAHELSRRGWRVLVVDKGPAVASGSTSASSAIVRFHYSTLDGVMLAWESALLWQRWGDHVGAADPTELARFHRTGMLVIEPPGMDSEHVLRLFDKVGVPYEVLDQVALWRQFPAFDLGSYFPPKAVDDDAFFGDAHAAVHGFSTPDAGFVDDPALAARNLMDAAVARGARFRFRTTVTGVERDDRVRGVVLDDGSTVRARVVVNAAGPWSGRVNALAGVHQPITTRPLRQEVHVVPAPPGLTMDTGAPSVGDLDLGTYFRPQVGGTLLVGGVEPECDPLVWVDDPDALDEQPTVAAYQAQSWRLGRRVPALGVPGRPVGLAALYDVTPDWTPIYDRADLDGWYQAIGTSGNQFKNAPMIGLLMSEIIEACESGHDHDAQPVHVVGPVTGNVIDLRQFSRQRSLVGAATSVMG